MTDAQELALRRLCDGYGVKFDADHYHPQFDLPPGYVAGWIGGNVFLPVTIYVGCSPEGEISS